MDIFNRGKSKGKKKHESPNIQTSNHTMQYTTPQSPISPHNRITTEDYFTLGEGNSIRSSQSSLPSTDSEHTNIDIMTENEIEDFFERMLSRRGIHDINARKKMSSFSIEKKRLMVAQDLQAETNRTVRKSDKKVDQQEPKGPEYYVRKLSDTSKGINTKIVSHLAVGLRTMPLSWVRQFIDMSGLQVITELLTTMNKMKANRQEVNLSAEADLLKCFKALLNNRVGAREALQHPQCIQQIVHCLISPSINSRRLVCEVLVFMCYYEIPVGQDLVLKAMDQLRDKQKGLGRFDVWLTDLEITLGGRGRMGSMVGASDDFKRMAAYGPPDNQLTEYALYNMILVNAIINVVDDPEIRIHLRNQMTASGLERVMEKMNELSDDHVDRQVREFKTLAENDQDEIMDMYHEYVLSDQNDPRDVFECILASVEGTRGYDFFLSCLQHILLINNEEGGLKSRYFQIIDNLVSQVVLDHKGLAEDFSAEYTTTVQHLINKFADQDQLKATLEDIKDLQASYDELLAERDLLREQLSYQGDALETVQLKEKTASLEDLLRMSRHTISTLQRKLRDLQADYEGSLSKAEKQLDELHSIIYENGKAEDDNIIIPKKLLIKEFEKIQGEESIHTQESLEGKGKAIDKRELFYKDENKYKSMALGLSEEFKSQLARQFGSSSALGDFVLPGAMSLMGSTTRKSNNRRKHVVTHFSPHASLEASIAEHVGGEENRESIKVNTTDFIPNRKDSLSSQSSITSPKPSVSLSLTRQESVRNTGPKSDVDGDLDNNTEDDLLSLAITTIDEENDIPTEDPTENNSESESTNNLSTQTTPSTSELFPPPPPPPPPPPIMESLLSKPAFTTNNSNSSLTPPPPPPPPPPSGFPSNQDPSDTLTFAPPPPPSGGMMPPPPPGGLSAALARKQMKHLPTVKTRQLQWQKLNTSTLHSTIWKSTLDENDEELQDLLLSEGIFNQMEEVFAQKVIPQKQASKKEKRPEICIIDSRKAHKINISVLAKCKNISFSEFKKKVLSVDEKFCTEVLLRNLLVNAPSHEETGKLSVFLQTASQEDLQYLSKPDAFCAEIIGIDRFKERIANMLFATTFNERITQLSRNMSNVMDASNNLKESEACREFLNIILMIGNFLNSTNFQGGAFGIRIGSINKLVDTRAASNDTTLLHFLCTMVESRFPFINDNLLADLALCGEACRVTIQDLIKDYNELRVGLQTLIHELDCHYGSEYDAPDGDRFSAAMYDFRDRAIEKFDQLEVRYTSMDIAYKDVVSYFGEDPSNMKPDEFFGIFQTFISSWKKAKSDIEKKKAMFEQSQKAKLFQEQRKANLKSRLKINEGTTESDDKDIMDNLLEKLRSGEMTTTSNRKSRRMSIRERRRTRAESMMVKAEDLLKHIQTEEETPPLPRPRAVSKRFTSSELMKKLASLAE